MASLYDFIDAFSRIRTEVKMMATAATEAAAEIARAGDSRMENNGSPGVGAGSISSSSLGDPRDASDYAARMVAAIRNATGR